MRGQRTGPNGSGSRVAENGLEKRNGRADVVDTQQRWFRISYGNSDRLTLHLRATTQ